MAGADHVRLIIVLCIAVTIAQQCKDYLVSVNQEDFLENMNVTLKCSYNIPEADTVIWRTKAIDSDRYRIAYTAYDDFPDNNAPAPEFVNKLFGRQEVSAHYLTIRDAAENDNINFWQCGVNTPSCTTNNDVIKLQLVGKYTLNQTFQAV